MLKVSFLIGMEWRTSKTRIFNRGQASLPSNSFPTSLPLPHFIHKLDSGKVNLLIHNQIELFRAIFFCVKTIK